MKKVLSVLLTVTMLLGCFSVGFVSFAASPADEAAMAQALKDTTTYATSKTPVTVNAGKWNEKSYFIYPATYSFSKLVNTTTTMPNDAQVIDLAGGQDAYEENLLRPILANEAYKSYITYDFNGIPQSIRIADMISDKVLLNDTITALGDKSVETTTNKPGEVGNNVLGDNALKVIELSADEMKNYNAARGTFNLDDIVIADQTDPDAVLSTTEDSSLAKVISVMASSAADEILAALKEKDGVRDVTNYVYKITGILVTPIFSQKTFDVDTVVDGVDYAAGESIQTLSSLKIAYNVEMSGDIRLDFSDIAFPVSAMQKTTVTYNAFTEVTDLSKPVVEDLVDLVNEKTAYAAEASEEDGHHASGYNFSKEVMVTEPMHTAGSSTLEDKANLALETILKSKYPEYDKYINTNAESTLKGKYFDDERGIYTYDDILIERLGLAANESRVYDGTIYSVAKGVNGAEVLDIDALKAMTIDSANVKSSTYDPYSKSIEFTFNDQVIYPAAGEDVIIADMYDNMLPEGLDKEIAENFNKMTLGSTIENVKLSYLSPVLNVKLDANDNLETVRLVYTVAYSATLYLADTVSPAPVSGQFAVTVNYQNIETFDEANDIDPYEFVKILNSATELAVAEKPAYNYERNASFSEGPTVDISANAIGTVTGLLDKVVGLVSPGTSLQESIAAKLKDLLLKDMNAEDFSGSVPVAKVGTDYLGASAVKATTLEPNDVVNIAYNAERGVFTFELRDQVNPEKDEMNALSRLTDDFTASQDLKDQLSIQLIGSFGIDLAKEEDPCEINYTGIKCYVGYEGADEDNLYGSGQLSTMGIGYNCSLNTTFSDINVTANEIVASEYNSFEYFDYEMGDADMSTRVSIVDARKVLQVVAGLDTLEGKNFELADMNGDGKISIIDAKLILKKVAYK